MNKNKFFYTSSGIYKEVDREARVGDTVIVTRGGSTFFDKHDVGKVVEVLTVNNRVDFNGFGNNVHEDGIWHVNKDKIVVIEPVYSGDYEDEKPSPLSDRDLILELAYSVVRIQRRVTRLEEGEDAERAKIIEELSEVLDKYAK